jgi:hypothetical protein
VLGPGVIGVTTTLCTTCPAPEVEVTTTRIPRPSTPLPTSCRSPHSDTRAITRGTHPGWSSARPSGYVASASFGGKGGVAS